MRPEVMRVPPGCPLSARQYEVLDLLAQGLTRKQIGQRLGISSDTVRSHLSFAYALLGVHNGANAVAIMGRKGWHGWVPTVSPPPPPPPPADLDAMEAAVHVQLQRWLLSGYRDQQARDAWHIAYRALRVARGLPAERTEGPELGPAHRHLRRLLHLLAQDTLHPTQR